MKDKNLVYTKDLVYHKKYPELPTVIHVEPLDGFCVRIWFKDGKIVERDLASHLRGPVFEPIRNDPLLFRQMFVDPIGGTIAWPGEVDLAPETLYYWDEPVPWMVEYEEQQKKKKARALRERKAKLKTGAQRKPTKAKTKTKRAANKTTRQKTVTAKKK
jgi:hypothetical protein